MADEMSLVCRLNKPTLPVLKTQQLVYVLVEAVPGPGIGDVQMPLNLSLVLDKSGSMAGKKIKHLREAAQMAVDMLGPEDYVSVIAFSNRVKVISESRQARDRAELKGGIDKIKDGGGTKISDGMKRGLSELYKNVKNVSKNTAGDRISRLVLLTDGQTFGDEPACIKLAEEAAKKGVVINALGLGEDWNEKLLDRIAEATGGVADFIDSPEKMTDFFRQEVLSMQSSVVQNARLVMRLVSGVTPRQVWQVLPMISNLGYLPLSERDVQVELGELQKGQGRTLLVELLLDPRPHGSYRIAQVELSYDVPGLGISGEKLKVDVMLNLEEDPTKSAELDPGVMNIVERITAFKLQTRALQEAEAGNRESAAGSLRAAATRLLELGENDLADAALKEAENLEEKGEMSPYGTKKLRYETRKLTQKLNPDM